MAAGDRYGIVDWKTGMASQDAKDARMRDDQEGRPPGNGLHGFQDPCRERIDRLNGWKIAGGRAIGFGAAFEHTPLALHKTGCRMDGGACQDRDDLRSLPGPLQRTSVNRTQVRTHQSLGRFLCRLATGAIQFRLPLPLENAPCAIEGLAVTQEVEWRLFE